MSSKFLPQVSAEKLKTAQASGNIFEYFDLLTQPLQEELYKRKTFDFLDELSEGQQLLLSYDYVQNQVLQGGFIQLIQNGYIGLLPDMPAWLTNVGATVMAQLIDDVLKVYVLNKDTFDKANSIEAFVKLYDELKEFEMIDTQFRETNEATLSLIMAYAENNLDEFITVYQ
jgi:hypothetical protein